MSDTWRNLPPYPGDKVWKARYQTLIEERDGGLPTAIIVATCCYGVMVREEILEDDGRYIGDYVEIPWRIWRRMLWWVNQHGGDPLKHIRQGVTGMSEWQLIETAPKDGTRVLGCTTIRGGGYYYPRTIYWRRENNGFSGWRYAGSEKWGDPTHWMPLPPPPSPTSEAPE